MFKIDVENLCWIDGSVDNSDDICLHGETTVKIGSQIFKYNATVSATALYLLKTLTENHIMHTSNQMLPCCGSFIIPNEDLTNVDICGCNNGIDWSVIHEDDCVKIVTESKNETIVSIHEYIEEVYKFTDKIESFYKKCTSKRLPYDDFEKNGYIAFWNEWNIRRNRKKELYVYIVLNW